MQHVKRIHNQCTGFTLMEVLVATVVLLIGIVAVAQLVPVSVGLDSRNLRDTTALVIAQREMDALMSQPVTTTTFTDPQGLTCPAATVCNLGNPATPLVPVGSTVIPNIGGRPYINYNAATVAGYNFLYSDPNDPSGSYDIRWAVITYANAGIAYGKRIILGVRKTEGNGSFVPISLDSMVEK